MKYVMPIIHIALCAFLVVILSGCEPHVPATSANQCIRAELFKQCMSILPAGPSTTKYNDWDEVVDSCASSAYYQSLRLTKGIPLECRVQ